MKNILFLIIMLILAIINSCKTDFDVNADWKDISVIYCLLNPNDSVHYVKLNKCFLGNESAYEMAQISDSTNYENAIVNLISGTLQTSGEFIEDENPQIIPLYITYTMPKDSGIFNYESGNNKIYKTNGYNNFLDISKDYKLLINIEGKDNIESNTPIISINDLKIIKPYSSFNLSEEGTTVVEWESIKNDKLYEFAILFKYNEIITNEDNSITTTTKTIKWPQKSKESKHTDGSESMSTSLKGESFLQFISSAIKSSSDYDPNANVKRVAYSHVVNLADPDDSRNKYPIELYFYTGTSDLNTYIQVSQPSNTIVQEKPSFSNITNGLGIFSCRANKSFKYKQITNQTISDLNKSSFTNDLNFMDEYETASYWSQNE